MIAPMTFTINGKQCETPTVIVPGSQWTCVTPAGAGYRQTVVAS